LFYLENQRAGKGYSSRIFEEKISAHLTHAGDVFRFNLKETIRKTRFIWMQEI
jgi:hypothetical protein